MDNTAAPPVRTIAPYAYPVSAEQDFLQALEAAALPGQGTKGSLPRLLRRVFAFGGLGELARGRLQALAAAAGCAVAPPAGEGEGLGPVLVQGAEEDFSRLALALQGEGPSLLSAGAQLSRALDAQRALQGRPRTMSWGRRRLHFGARPLVMGILNCTPDSFYPGSRQAETGAAVAAAARMVAEGADILDVGGESTRPGSDTVSADEEISRVLPVVEALRRRWDLPVSIDTRKAAVARVALDAGADLVNDTGAMDPDPRLLALVAQRGVPVVLMHMRGEPKTMQLSPHYEDVVGEVIGELGQALERAATAGVSRERIIVDPGIGFGKRCQDNLSILRRLRAFTCLGCPLLVGLSRKSFLGTVLDRPVEQRLVGTVSANTLAVLGGADIVRVHDVREAAEMARVIEAVRLERCDRQAAG